MENITNTISRNNTYPYQGNVTGPCTGPVTAEMAIAEGAKKTEINVISKEEFEAKTKRVFELLYQTLSKSFGPYGAPTIIYKYPFSHITKDGFTIAKSLSMNVADGYTNQAIANMALDICGRMNTVVGDGTTSAIVCVNNIYQNYLKNRDWFKEASILPRDVLYHFRLIKDMIDEELQNAIVPITGELVEKEEMLRYIEKVVEISANGDESIVHTIVDLYDKLEFPAITCDKSTDGEERVIMVDGYRLPLYITDRMYINNDNETMELANADVLVFTCKITEDIYQGIILPIMYTSGSCGRKLLVAAPNWDEILIDRTIAPMLRSEYSKYKQTTLIVTAYKAANSYQRKSIEDFAMLCHTTAIDRACATKILKEISDKKDLKPIEAVTDIIDVFRRHLPTSFPLIRESNGERTLVEYDRMTTNKSMITLPNIRDDTIVSYNAQNNDYRINLGYCEDLELGLKTSTIHKFFYDKEEYEMHMKEATSDLEEVTLKYKRLGTFNVETTKAQQRVFSLRLKLAVIEVGGDSDLSLSMRKDIYDDAIKAASSAFKYGVIKGCNLSTIQAINKVLYKYRVEDPDNALDDKLLTIIKSGFMDTYKTVLSNWREDVPVVAYDERYSHPSHVDLPQTYKNLESVTQKYCGKNSWKVFECNNEEVFDKYLLSLVRAAKENTKSNNITFYDLILAHSALTGKVFDVTKKEFSDDVINSYQTDSEILTAVIDLLSLLISGNQMVVTQRNSFES